MTLPRLFRILGTLCAILICSSTALAVTDKEMDHARAIAAQCYLRYANNGSGYLDEFQATSMSELESKLKSKEKENIKAFKSIDVPSGYASWDKAKLVEYWSVTAFSSPKLIAEGKAAKSRVKARINAMNVSAPAAAGKSTAQTAEKPSSETAANTNMQPAASETAVPADIIPEEPQPSADMDSLAAQTQEAAQEVVALKKEDSSTWIYVAILCVLIVVVIALVVYAARTMKGSEGKSSAPTGGESGRTSSYEKEAEAMREKFGKTLASKNEELTAKSSEIGRLSASVESERQRAAQLELRLEKALAEVEALRAENASLKSDLEKYKTQGNTVAPSQGNAASVAAPRKRQIFLGRVNSRGIFVRADRNFDPAHDVYCLETADGMTGSFFVVPDATLTEMALLTPEETLGGGCDGNLSDADTATSLTTEMRGSAVLEDNRWKVSRKARIRLS